MKRKTYQFFGTGLSIGRRASSSANGNDGIRGLDMVVRGGQICCQNRHLPLGHISTAVLSVELLFAVGKINQSS